MNTKLTEIAYILDRSGSMDSLQEAAISGFNSFLKEQRELEGDVSFSLVLFDDEYLLLADRISIHDVEPLDTKSFVPRGVTALLDAIGKTVDSLGKKLAKTPEEERPSSVIVAIYTDGYENASKIYTQAKIREIIKHQTEVYQWDFLFLAANEDAIATSASYGIASANASSVAYSAMGMKSATVSLSKKIKSKRRMMSGQASEEDMYYASASMSEIVGENEKE